MLRASRRCVLLWVRGEVAKAFRRWSGRASRLMICADASMRIERIMMRALRRLVATARARAFAAFPGGGDAEKPSPRPPCHNKAPRPREVSPEVDETIFIEGPRDVVHDHDLLPQLAEVRPPYPKETARHLLRHLVGRELSISTARDGFGRCGEWYEAVFDTLAPPEARARAYRKWSGRCSQLKLRSDSIKRLDRVRRRCLQRIRHATLLKALNTWIHGRDLYRFLEGHSIKATSALRRVLKRWLHREKAKALEAWFRTVSFMRGMERVVARIVHRLVAKAWVTWTGDVSAGHIGRALHLRGPWTARGASSCGYKGSVPAPSGNGRVVCWCCEERAPRSAT